MNFGVDSKVLSVLLGGLGVAAALMLAAPATADPEVPLPAPASPLEAAIAAPAPAPVGPAPGPAPDGTVVAAAGELPKPPDGMQHLSSPDNLPPGATMDPSVKNGDGPNVSYLKDLWQAVQNHEISGKEAVIMGLAQRGMNTPYPQQAPGPNVPVGPAPPAEPVAPVAPPPDAPPVP